MICPICQLPKTAQGNTGQNYFIVIQVSILWGPTQAHIFCYRGIVQECLIASQILHGQFYSWQLKFIINSNKICSFFTDSALKFSIDVLQLICLSGYDAMGKNTFFECKQLFYHWRTTCFSSFSGRVTWSVRWVHWNFAEISFKNLEFINKAWNAWNICVRTIWQFDSNPISCQIIRVHHLKWRWQVLNPKKMLNNLLYYLLYLKLTAAPSIIRTLQHIIELLNWLKIFT